MSAPTPDEIGMTETERLAWEASEGGDAHCCIFAFRDGYRAGAAEQVARADLWEKLHDNRTAEGEREKARADAAEAKLAVPEDVAWLVKRLRNNYWPREEGRVVRDKAADALAALSRENAELRADKAKWLAVAESAMIEGIKNGGAA